ncbi:hypothetical protein D1007_19068 [Hordeum vulgare]|nr:hypothetical protein D1007_19068 [Hordeum vulgare]
MPPRARPYSPAPPYADPTHLCPAPAPTHHYPAPPLLASVPRQPRPAAAPRQPRPDSPDALLNNEKAPKSPDTVAASQSAESPFPSFGDSAQLDSCVPSLAEAAKPGFRKAEKHSKNALRSVSELHIGDEKRVGSRKFHMDKVLKGFGARRASRASSDTNIQAGDVPLKSSEMCPSKITIPGKKAPLDLSLKTTLQFVSSSSVKCGNCLDKQSCNAYLSQSTRGIRSLLRKQGVFFSMPICEAEVEDANEDDLLEFSKIRTLDLGQVLFDSSTFPYFLYTDCSYRTH